MYSRSPTGKGDIRKKSLISSDINCAPFFESDIVELRRIFVSMRLAVGEAVSLS